MELEISIINKQLNENSNKLHGISYLKKIQLGWFTVRKALGSPGTLSGVDKPAAYFLFISCHQLQRHGQVNLLQEPNYRLGLRT